MGKMKSQNVKPLKPAWALGYRRFTSKNCHFVMFHDILSCFMTFCHVGTAILAGFSVTCWASRGCSNVTNVLHYITDVLHYITDVLHYRLLSL